MHAMTAVLASATIALTGVTPAHVGPATTKSKARDAVYGGFTSQGWAVVVNVNGNRRVIDRAAIGGDLGCTSGGYLSLLDPYAGVPVSRHGAFKSVYQDVIARADDGSFGVFGGSLTGKANAAQTKMTGTWRMHLQMHDPSGAVVDECDTGLVHWTARR